MLTEEQYSKVVKQLEDPRTYLLSVNVFQEDRKLRFFTFCEGFLSHDEGEGYQFSGRRGESITLTPEMIREGFFPGGGSSFVSGVNEKGEWVEILLFRKVLWKWED